MRESSEQHQRPTIVIAEEEPELMFTIQRQLRELVGWDYDILLTLTADKALAYVSSRRVELVITEYQFLRGMSGLDLARQVKARSPRTRVLLNTGALGAGQAPAEVDFYAAKPLAIDDLRDTLRAALTL